MMLLYIPYIRGCCHVLVGRWSCSDHVAKMSLVGVIVSCLRFPLSHICPFCCSLLCVVHLFPPEE